MLRTPETARVLLPGCGRACPITWWGCWAGRECVPAPAVGASVNAHRGSSVRWMVLCSSYFQHVRPPVQHIVADARDLRPRSHIALLRQHVDGGPQEI